MRGREGRDQVEGCLVVREGSGIGGFGLSREEVEPGIAGGDQSWSWRKVRFAGDGRGKSSEEAAEGAWQWRELGSGAWRG